MPCVACVQCLVCLSDLSHRRLITLHPLPSALFYSLLQVIQKHYDELAVAEGEDDPVKAAEAEAMAKKMIDLLTLIENDRLKYTEKRDNLKRMKQR